LKAEKYMNTLWSIIYSILQNLHKKYKHIPMQHKQVLLQTKKCIKYVTFNITKAIMLQVDSELFNSMQYLQHAHL
jgi:hypothetical protein